MRRDAASGARTRFERAATHADGAGVGGLPLRGGRESSAWGRHDPEKRQESQQNAGLCVSQTLRGACSGDTHLASGAWPAFVCAPAVAIVSVLVVVIQSDGVT